MRLLIDADINPALVPYLSAKRYQATSVLTIPRVRDYSDDRILLYAVANRMAVITRNGGDYKALDAEWTRTKQLHYGIVTVPPINWPERLAPLILAALQPYTNIRGLLIPVLATLKKTPKRNPPDDTSLAILTTLYRALYKKARAKHPELPPVPVAMEVTPEARTSDRSYAFFRYPGRDGRVRGTRDGSRCGVKLSPELALNEDRALAVVAHEIGHAVDHWVDPDDLARRLAHVARPDGRGTVAAAGLPSSLERLADLIGETILGQPIFYDAELVQTIAPGGKRPRPAHLG